MNESEETLLELAVLILAGVIAALIRKYCLYRQEHIHQQSQNLDESKRDRS